MIEINKNISGTILPEDVTPLLIPSLKLGVWTASQTGNIVTVTSTSGYSHALPSRSADPNARISDYGVRVYLQFPYDNGYIYSGWYKNIVIVNSNTFTCISDTTLSSPSPSVMVQSLGNIEVKLTPFTMYIPKGAVTIHSSVKTSAFISFHSPAIVTQKHRILLGSGRASGLFYNFQELPQSTDLPSYYLSQTFKILAKNLHMGNPWAGGYNTFFSYASPVTYKSEDQINWEDGFEIVPYIAIDSTLNDYQMWSHIKTEFTR